MYKSKVCTIIFHIPQLHHWVFWSQVWFHALSYVKHMMKEDGLTNFQRNPWGYLLAGVSWYLMVVYV